MKTGNDTHNTVEKFITPEAKNKLKTTALRIGVRIFTKILNLYSPLYYNYSILNYSAPIVEEKNKKERSYTMFL